MTDLGTLGGRDSYASGINDAGSCRGKQRNGQTERRMHSDGTPPTA